MTSYRDLIEYAELSDGFSIDASQVLAAVGSNMHLDNYYSDNPFTQVPLVTWVCSDTYVGYYAVKMYRQVIAFTLKPYRKAEKIWFWVSAENAADPRPAILRWAVEKHIAEVRFEWDPAVSQEDLKAEITASDITLNTDLVKNVFEELK